MPRPRQRYTRRGSAVKPRYLWETVITNLATVPTLGNALTDMMPTDPLLTETQNRDLRVVRIVGNMAVAPLAFSGTIQTISWVQGILPVTAQAFAIGATAVPNPAVDQPGWMYLKHIPYGSL